MLRSVPAGHRAGAVGSMTALPFASASFDAAYATESLEHAVEIDVAVAEMCRVVTPGGRIAIIDKNAEHWGRLKTPEWERWFRREELERLLARHCRRGLQPLHLLLGRRRARRAVPGLAGAQVSHAAGECPPAGGGRPICRVLSVSGPRPIEAELRAARPLRVARRPELCPCAHAAGCKPAGGGVAEAVGDGAGFARPLVRTAARRTRCGTKRTCRKPTSSCSGERKSGFGMTAGRMMLNYGEGAADRSRRSGATWRAPMITPASITGSARRGLKCCLCRR